MIAHDSTPILLGEIDTIKAGENVKKKTQSTSTADPV